MILLRANLFNTTTQFTNIAGWGTSSVAVLFDREKTSIVTSTSNTVTASSQFKITFASTQTVSSVILLNHNWSGIVILKDTITGAVLFNNQALGSTYNNHYAAFTSTLAKELAFSVETTTVADQYKYLGELIITDSLYNFTSDRLPNAAEYNPFIDKMQIIHAMSDGGTSIYNIKNKFKANISMSFVPTSTFSTLKTIYDLNAPFIFIPFETATAWNADIAEVVWPGTFNFMKFSDNLLGNGYTGLINIAQTPGGSF